MNKQINLYDYDAKELALFAHQIGLDIDDLEYKITLAKRSTLHIARESMPVIETNQIKLLQNMLLNAGIKFKQIITSAYLLKPVQTPIYFDKSVYSILDNGLHKTNIYLHRYSTITVSKDFYIIDGHHRWLSAMIINPKLKIKVFQIGLTFTEVYRPMIAYSNILNNKRKK